MCKRRCMLLACRRSPFLLLLCVVAFGNGAGAFKESLLRARAKSVWRPRVLEVRMTGVDGRLGGGFAPLRKWVESFGGKTAGVAIVDDPALKGWGLHAAADAAAGDVLASVPRELCLSLASPAVQHPCLSALLRRVPNDGDRETWAMKLGLALLSERVRPGSFFAPYIGALPAGHSGIPLFFGPGELTAIQDSVVIAEVKRRCRQLIDFTKKELANAAPPAPGDAATAAMNGDPFSGHVVNVNSLGWGVVTAASRAMYLTGPDGLPELVPFVDMANHALDPNAEVVAVPGTSAGSEGEVRLVALRPIRAGEPVEISYGDLANDQTLLDYGFIEARNSRDRVCFRLETKLLTAARAVAGIAREPFGGAGGDDDIEPWQLRYLQQLNIEGPGSDRIMALSLPTAAAMAVGMATAAAATVPAMAVTSGDGVASASAETTAASATAAAAALAPAEDAAMVEETLAGVDGRLLAALRVLFAGSKAELRGMPAAALTAPTARVSASNERRVLSTVVGLCAVLLRAYGSSLRDDVELLYGPAEEALQKAGLDPVALGATTLPPPSKPASGAEAEKASADGNGGGSGSGNAGGPPADASAGIESNHDAWLQYLSDPQAATVTKNKSAAKLPAGKKAAPSSGTRQEAAIDVPVVVSPSPEGEEGGRGGRTEVRLSPDGKVLILPGKGRGEEVAAGAAAAAMAVAAADAAVAEAAAAAAAAAAAEKAAAARRVATSWDASVLAAALAPPRWGYVNPASELSWDMITAIDFRITEKRVLTDTIREIGAVLGGPLGIVNGRQEMIERVGAETFTEIERWDPLADDDDDEEGGDGGSGGGGGGGQSGEERRRRGNEEEEEGDGTAARDAAAAAASAFPGEDAGPGGVVGEASADF